MTIPTNLRVSRATQSVITSFLMVVNMRQTRLYMLYLPLLALSLKMGMAAHKEHHQAMVVLSSWACLPLVKLLIPSSFAVATFSHLSSLYLSLPLGASLAPN